MHFTRRTRKKKRKFKKRGLPIEEQILFHGTNSKNIEKIVTEGFKIGGKKGHAVTNGTSYGKGIYTAKSNATPISYSRDRNVVIALKAITGKKNTHWRSPCKEKDWIILQSSKQTLPCYIVHFNPGQKPVFDQNNTA